MLKTIIGIAALLLALTVPAFAASNATGEQTAIKAAESWLALVDGGKYGQSWRESAEYFRNAVTLEQWEQSLTSVRRPLGRLVSRKVQDVLRTTTLPGAPDGDYVVIRFATSFDKKKSAIETVTPMRERNGTWRVSGYYIK
ncbi:DUF4019 domain-containing protein [bacterium]|nr:DUF4019 domain-containing protein [bacterium]